MTYHEDHVIFFDMQVTRESALMFNPDATITAIHDSILKYTAPS